MAASKPFIFVRRHGQVRAYLDRLELDVPTDWEGAMDRVADVYIGELRSEAPVDQSGDPRRTPGELRDSFYKRWARRGRAPRIVIGNRAPHYKLVTRGRGAIDQRLKPLARRWPLHFWVDGKELWRWRVGPAAPNRFDLRAIQKARPKAARVLREQVRHIAQQRST